MIKYKSGFKYQLTKDYRVHVGVFPKKPIKTTFISVSIDGCLKVRAGYAWDGPSGPAIDTKNFMRGSLVHDILYQLIRSRLLPKSTRKHADQLLRTMCIEDGMWRIRAWWVYHSLRFLGGPAASTSGRRKTLTAP